MYDRTGIMGVWMLYKSTAKTNFDSKQIPQTSVNRSVSLIFLERLEGWSTDGKVANVFGEGNSSLWGSLCASQVPGGRISGSSAVDFRAVRLEV